MGRKDDVTNVTVTGRGKTATFQLNQLWQQLSLRSQFLIVASLILSLSMAILGEWVNLQIAASQLQSRADSGALYMEGFLARHVQSGDLGPTVTSEGIEELDELLINPDLARRIDSLRIWRRDGLILYSTDKALIGKTFPSPSVEAAFLGKVSAHLESGHDDEGNLSPAEERPLIEIYAPIYREGTRDTLAVGEVYEDASDFIERRDDVQRRTWYIVAATTLAILAALYAIVRRADNLIGVQRNRLKSQLADAKAMAQQNRDLRELANKARLEASKSNESLLNRIGSDLHDGPMQLLALLILRLGQATTRTEDVPENLTPSSIATECLTQLRDLSTGLVMPQIDELSLEDALRLAVDRHQFTTGTWVGANYTRLPVTVASSLKICLYRIVQEGLNNAFRHGNGIDQHIDASADERNITITVSDGGPGLPLNRAGKDRLPLGLLGIHNRVEAFNGTLKVRRRDGRRTELVVIVPLNGNSD
ncbi:sensor histidine kinase [Pararhizobium sp. DWP3-4]|uniref:sensor histidine kinase n=1 Tax=Pararhizobium sp. DWP3-4 TaxID=2804565 RepID=UPI003CEF86DE